MKLYRLGAFILCVVVSFLLVHEYVKEGYMFRWMDLFKFPTHESLILLALICYALFVAAIGVRRRLRSST